MNTQTALDWFPQEYAPYFFMVKGVLGLVSTVLLVYHMSKTWTHVVAHGTLGQRMRYYALLAFSILVTGSSAEQLTEEQLVSYRHLGAMIVMVLLIAAAVVSIVEDRKRTVSSRVSDTGSEPPKEDNTWTTHRPARDTSDRPRTSRPETTSRSRES